jgi:hypothetical protein
MNRLPLLVASIASATLALACGDNGGSTGAEPAPAEPCAQTDADACRVDQRACRLDAGEPSCFACDPGSYVERDGACAPIGGEVLRHEFTEFTTGPGEEVLGLCQSWTLGNETELWINAVELDQTEASHHSNWTFVPDERFEGPDGVWPCEERGYDQLTAAVAGGVLYAQSTQASHEVQKFPGGAAIRIPPRARIIGDVHLLNSGKEPITGTVALTLYAIDPSDVTVKLAPFHMTYDGLDIPPQSTSRFTGECEMAETLTKSTGGPLALQLYYALPHTHALGTRFFLEAVGGAHDGQALLDVTGFNGEARGRFYDPPLDLSDVTALRFGCEFQNPRAEPVGWGFGDQEMCEMLGFIASPVAFESRVSEAQSVGDDGAIATFTGPCSTLVVPWTDK